MIMANTGCIVYTCLLFSLIFSGYAIMSQYLMLLYPNIGPQLSSLLFFSMCFSTILGPYISNYVMGVKWTIVIGTIGITIWLLAINIESTAVITTATIMCGFGVGLFRGHQNVWVSYQNIGSDVGYYIALGNSIFTIYVFIVATVGLVLAIFTMSIIKVLNVYLIIMLVAQFALLFINNPQITKKNFNYVALLKTNVWILLPLSQIQSINICILYTIVPHKMNTEISNSNLALSLLASMFLAYSLANSLTYYSVGILFKKINSIIFFVISITLSFVIAVMLMGLFDFDIIIDNANIIITYGYVVILGIMLGIYDGIIPNINLILLAMWFDKNIFCLQRLTYCLTIAMFTFMVKYFNWHMYLVLLISLNIISLICYVIFYATTIKHNYHKDEENERDRVGEEISLHDINA